jgi:hypothetical protein
MSKILKQQQQTAKTKRFRNMSKFFKRISKKQRWRDEKSLQF